MPAFTWFTSAWTAEHLDIWPTTSALWSSWLTVSHQYDAGHPSYDDVTGRQSICRRRTACLEQPAIRDPSLSLSIFWKLLKNYLFKGRGAGDLWTGTLEMYWLTN